MTVLAELVLLLARLGAATFAGACAYIALVQQPARMTLPVEDGLDDFRRTIPYAERLQAPLLVVSIVAGVLAAVLEFRWPTLLGTLLLVVVLAQTIATVLPINRRLLSGAAVDHLAEARGALSGWGRLHAVRTVVATAAAVLLLV